VALEPIRCLAKKPERSAGQAGGVLKYRRLALLDSYVFWLINGKDQAFGFINPAPERLAFERS